MNIAGVWRRGSEGNRGGRICALGTVATAALLIGAAPANATEAIPAADAPADSITVTATRIPQSVIDVPATVSVIDADKIGASSRPRRPSPRRARPSPR
jgi:outer membrane cobalamin receptor